MNGGAIALGHPIGVWGPDRHDAAPRAGPARGPLRARDAVPRRWRLRGCRVRTRRLTVASPAVFGAGAGIGAYYGAGLRTAAPTSPWSLAVTPRRAPREWPDDRRAGRTGRIACGLPTTRTRSGRSTSSSSASSRTTRQTPPGAWPLLRRAGRRRLRPERDRQRGTDRGGDRLAACPRWRGLHLRRGHGARGRGRRGATEHRLRRVAGPPPDRIRASGRRRRERRARARPADVQVPGSGRNTCCWPRCRRVRHPSSRSSGGRPLP